MVQTEISTIKDIYMTKQTACSQMTPKHVMVNVTLHHRMQEGFSCTLKKTSNEKARVGKSQKKIDS